MAEAACGPTHSLSLTHSTHYYFSGKRMSYVLFDTLSRQITASVLVEDAYTIWIENGNNMTTAAAKATSAEQWKWWIVQKGHPNTHTAAKRRKVSGPKVREWQASEHWNCFGFLCHQIPITQTIPSRGGVRGRENEWKKPNRIETSALSIFLLVFHSYFPAPSLHRCVSASASSPLHPCLARTVSRMVFR